jgi:Calx-beta domain/IPTL-CTERM motif
MAQGTIVSRQSNSVASKGLRGSCTSVLIALAATIAAPPAMSTQGDAANFSAVSVTVSESAGAVTLTVLRQGVGGGTASVDYASANFTATAPSDYGAVSGTLSWGDGDLTPRTITIPIVDDAAHENDETFFVALSNPQGLSTGVLPSETVIISDNDAAAATVSTPTLSEFGVTLLAGLLALAAGLALKGRSLRR